MPHKNPEEKRKYHAEYYHRVYKKKCLDYSKTKKLENPELYMWRRAKARAKKAGLEFSIEVEDIFIPKNCPVFGFKLEFNIGGFKDNSASLDRIDNSKGYVKGNIQVISYKANAMKNSATFEEVEKLYFFLKPEGYVKPDMRGI